MAPTNRHSLDCSSRRCTEGYRRSIRRTRRHDASNNPSVRWEPEMTRPETAVAPPSLHPRPATLRFVGTWTHPQTSRLPHLDRQGSLTGAVVGWDAGGLACSRLRTMAKRVWRSASSDGRWPRRRRGRAAPVRMRALFGQTQVARMLARDAARGSVCVGPPLRSGVTPCRYRQAKYRQTPTGRSRSDSKWAPPADNRNRHPLPRRTRAESRPLQR
jgi:hypothetical protein